MFQPKARWTMVAAIAGVAAIGALFAAARGQLATPVVPGQAPAHRMLDDEPSVASMPPVVIKTDPIAGTTDVDAYATKEIRVTFSKPMLDGNWAFGQISDGTFPKVTAKPNFLDDKATCVLPVSLSPGKTYVLWINRPPQDSFMDADHHKAIPYLLVFQTSGD